jgi:hypothetical protein
MFGSVILDVAIGLILVYLLLSLIASAIREGIEAWLKTRSVHLERGIRELLHDPSGTTLASDFYNHPLIYSLFRGEYNPSKIQKTRGQKAGDMKFGSMPSRSDLPSYIPSRNFALALMDIVVRGPAAGDPSAADDTAPVLNLNSLRARVAELQNPPVQRALLTAIDTADGNLAQVQENIEQWFDSGMDRVSGWYKRKTQGILLVIGAVITVGLNVNTITIAEYLYQNKPARDALVAQATHVDSAAQARRDSAAAVGGDSIAATGPVVADPLGTLQALKLPIGWSPNPYRLPKGADAGDQVWAIIVAVFGLAATAFAMSFGAPFWFDLLNKFMVVRATVKPHEKSPDEASEDRQRPNRTSGSGPGSPAGTGPGGTGSGDPPAPAGSSSARPGAVPATEPQQTNSGQAGADSGEAAASAATDRGGDYQPQEWAEGEAQKGRL